MIEASDIKEILIQHQSEVKTRDWNNELVHDCYCIKNDKYSEVANEILSLTMEQAQENAVLSAKVNVYEAIIENSNFKMAVKRSEK